PLATVTKWLGNTPSVALRHYVDPTETAFDRAINWRPEKSGAESGAPVAQNQTQRLPVANGGESQRAAQGGNRKSSTREEGTCRDVVLASGRECMGIEPTESFVQTPRWF